MGWLAMLARCLFCGNAWLAGEMLCTYMKDVRRCLSLSATCGVICCLELEHGIESMLANCVDVGGVL